MTPKPAQSDAPSAAEFQDTWKCPLDHAVIAEGDACDVAMLEAYAALRTAQLQSELVNQQRESAQIRRAYLHEKWCKETAEAKVAQLERERDTLANTQRQKNIDKYCKRAKDAEAETSRLRAKAKCAIEMCENIADAWNDLRISEVRRKELTDAYISKILAHDYDNDVDGWVMFKREWWLEDRQKCIERAEAAESALSEARERTQKLEDAIRPIINCTEIWWEEFGWQVVDELRALLIR